jgi:hypothetical protein
VGRAFEPLNQAGKGAAEKDNEKSSCMETATRSCASKTLHLQLGLLSSNIYQNKVPNTACLKGKSGQIRLKASIPWIDHENTEEEILQLRIICSACILMRYTRFE